MPRLLLVRHAIAQDRDEAFEQQLSDAERPLTNKGRRRMRRIAAGLHHTTGAVERILSSPLRRAHQTAEILSIEYPDCPVILCDVLGPGQPIPSLIPLLAEEANEGTLIVIGHEPDLGQLISLLLCGYIRATVQLKKGGAAMLDFPGKIGSAQGQLLWLLTPRQLRALGNSWQ